MSYNMMGMGGMGMGGMGGGMGMGGGGSSTMMMSASSACLSLCLSAGAAYLYMNSSGTKPPVEVPEVTTAPGPTEKPGPVTGDFDGARLVTVGGFGLTTSGKCDKSRVQFSIKQGSNANWILKKIGDDSAGVPFYAIQSNSKSWFKNCAARFLTAKLGCKSPPYLAKMSTDYRQYWYIVSSGNGYTIQNVACKRSNWPGSYLYMIGGGKKDGAPSFVAARSATAFSIEVPAESLV